MAEDEEWDENSNSETEPSEDESSQRAMPEGRRVVREQGRKGGSTSRETVYLKRREVQREMRGEDTAPVGVRQQIERLKKAKKSKTPMEERWGSASHRRRGARWVILVVLVVGIPLVAALIGISLFRTPPAETKTFRNPTLNLDDPGVSHLPYDSTSPVAWFHENSVGAFEDAMKILERCNEASVPADLSEVLRDGERTLTKMKASAKTGWELPFFLDDPREIKWEYGEAGDTGYMWISGRRADHSPFRAYFVKTDEGLKLDWDATVAWCQVPVNDLVVRAPKRATLMRVWLGKQPDYDAEIGRGSLYSWYLVLGEDKEHFVWAYAPAGSRTDLEIKGLLNYGRIIMARKNEVRVTMRLVKPTLGFRDNEFEIAELLTAEWVMP